MIVFKVYLDAPIEDAEWLYTTLEVAKASAEKSAKDNIEAFAEDVSVVFTWRHEMELRATEETIEKREEAPWVEIDEERLYYQMNNGPEEATSWIVGPVEVYEAVNF